MKKIQSFNSRKAVTRKLRAGPHGSCDNQQYLETESVDFRSQIQNLRKAARRGLFLLLGSRNCMGIQGTITKSLQLP